MKLNRILILISSMLFFSYQCIGCEKMELKDVNGNIYAYRLEKKKSNRLYFLDSTGKNIKVCVKPDVKAIVPELSNHQYISSHLNREETADIHGFILLAIYVDENDKIVEYRVVPSYTSQLCEKCVTQALDLMKDITICESAIQNGKKVKSIVYVRIPFK